MRYYHQAVMGKTTVTDTPTTGALPKFWDQNDLSLAWEAPPSGSSVNVSLSNYDGSVANLSLTAVDVTNRSQLDAAIANNRLIRLAPGNYGSNLQLINGLNNCIIWSTTRWGAVFDAADSTGFCIGIGNTDGVGVIGCSLLNAQVWSVASGGGYGASWRGPNNNTWIMHNRVYRSGQELLKFDQGKSGSDTGLAIGSNAVVMYNHLDGPGLSAPEYGEMIYFGNGNNQDKNQINGFLVQYNYMTTTTGLAAEVIDIKPNSRSGRIFDNFIDHCSVTLVGAITLWQGSYNANADAQIHRNRIAHLNSEPRTISPVGFDNNDAGIFINHGVVANDNIIWGCGRSGFFLKNAGSTDTLKSSSNRTFSLTGNTTLSNGIACEKNFDTGAPIAEIEQLSNNYGDDSTWGTGNFNNINTASLDLTGLADSGSGPGSAIADAGFASAYWTS